MMGCALIVGIINMGAQRLDCIRSFNKPTIFVLICQTRFASQCISLYVLRTSKVHCTCVKLMLLIIHYLDWLAAFGHRLINGVADGHRFVAIIN